MSTAPFPINPELTAIAIAYKNPDISLIADSVLPRVKPVGTREFKYTVYDLSQYNNPNSLVGRKGSPHEVSMTAKEKTAAIEDFGLDDLLPQDDIDQAQKMGRNLAGESTEYIMNLIKLDREVRVAKIVQDSDNYGTDLTSSLSGNKLWSDPASKPLDDLLKALEKPYMRPNTLVLSSLVWQALRVHSQIVKSLFPLSQEGAVTKEQLATLLEINNVFVGTSRINTQAKGKEPILAPTWGKNAALLYLDRTADSGKGVTWGMTVPYQTPIAGTIIEPKVGLRGALRVRAGESLKELVTSKEAGYLFKGVIA